MATYDSDNLRSGAGNESDDDHRLAAALVEYQYAAESGTPPNRAKFLARFPDLANRLDDCLNALAYVDAVVSPPPRPQSFGKEITLGPGSIVGEFRLVREVGRGGMGVVYEAIQQTLGRRVAVKVLPVVASVDERSIQRFRHEAQAAATLQHPHIVPIYAVGRDGDIHYFAMQFIEGRSLQAYLKEWLQISPKSTVTDNDSTRTIIDSPTKPSIVSETGLVGRPKTERISQVSTDHYRFVARLITQAADAIHHAHEYGIVHRDIKPGNLLVDAKNHLWVADFGLAKLPGSDLTGTADVMGTLRYMSPEQASGRGVTLDGRADVYSLGITLYELLTRTPAFDAEDQRGLLRKVIEEDPIPLRKRDRVIPIDLETICLKAIAKEPFDRYQTAAAFRDDLQRFLDDRPIEAKPPTVAQRSRKWVKRNRLMVTVLTIATAVAAVVSIGVLAYSNDVIGRKQRDTQNALDGEKLARIAERRMAYLRGVSLAHREWLAGDLARAESILANCPEEYRRWEWHYLSDLCQPELLVIPTSNIPLSINVTTDGQIFAGSSNGMDAWSLESGRSLPLPERIIEQNERGLAVSSDGNRVVTMGTAKTPLKRNLPFSRFLNLYHDQTGESVNHLTLLQNPREQLRLGQQPRPVTRFSPDGRLLAAAAPLESRIQLWDTETGQERAVLTSQTSTISDLAFSPDGRQLASVTRNGTIMIWEISTGKVSKRISVKSPSNSFLCITYSPNGKSLTVGTPEGSVQSFNTTNSTVNQTLRLDGNGIIKIDYRPDGSELALAENANNLITIRSIGRMTSHRIRGHTGPITDFVYTPDGSRIVSAGRDQTIRVFEATSPQHAKRIGYHPGMANSLTNAFAKGISINRDGSRVAIIAHRTVIVHDIMKGEKIAQFECDEKRFGEVHVAAFGPDGQTLCAIGVKGLAVWHIDSGMSIHEEESHLFVLPIIPGGVGEQRRELKGYLRSRAITFTPSGDYYAANHSVKNPNVQKFSVFPNAVPLPPLDRNVSAHALTLSDDGQTAVYSQREKKLFLFDPNGRTKQAIEIENTVIGMNYSKNGNRLAAGVIDGSVRVYDVATGALIVRLEGADQKQMNPVFSPDGERLALGVGLDGEKNGGVRIWDTETWQEMMTIPFTAPIEDLAFTPDGQQLVAFDHAGDVWVLDGRSRTREQKVGETAERRRYWNDTQATIAENEKQQFTAEWHINQLLKAHPGDVDLERRRNLIRAKAGVGVEDLDPEAMDKFIAGLDPSKIQLGYKLAGHFLEMGDHENYRRVCKRLLSFQRSTTFFAESLIIRLSLIAPNGVDDLDVIRKRWDLDVQANPDPFAGPLIRGMIQFRQGEYANAKTSFLEGENHGPKSQSHAIAWLFLAMTEFKLGQKQEAMKWLNKADTWYGEQMKKVSPGKPPIDYQIAIPFPHIRREAAALIGVNE